MRARASKGPKVRRQARLRLVPPSRSAGAANGSTPTVARWIPVGHSVHIRWSKVMTAQARMAVGYYDREDVKERVLDAVLRELTRH